MKQMLLTALAGLLFVQSQAFAAGAKTFPNDVAEVYDDAGTGLLKPLMDSLGHCAPSYSQMPQSYYSIVNRMPYYRYGYSNMLSGDPASPFWTITAATSRLPAGKVAEFTIDVCDGILNPLMRLDLLYKNGSDFKVELIAPNGSHVALRNLEHNDGKFPGGTMRYSTPRLSLIEISPGAYGDACYLGITFDYQTCKGNVMPGRWTLRITGGASASTLYGLFWIVGPSWDELGRERYGMN